MTSIERLRGRREEEREEERKEEREGKGRREGGGQNKLFLEISHPCNRTDRERFGDST